MIVRAEVYLKTISNASISSQRKLSIFFLSYPAGDIKDNCNTGSIVRLF